MKVKYLIRSSALDKERIVTKDEIEELAKSIEYTILDVIYI